MSKHTPGPWKRLGGVCGGQGIAAAKDPGWGVLLTVYGADAEEGQANVSLIAAAPRLLATAKAVLQWARTPGDHGGNPYCKEFVKLAEQAVQEAEAKQ